MKNTKNQKVIIINFGEFRNTINSPERIKIVLENLKNSPSIINNIIAVYYSDEGLAIFQVIENTPHNLKIEFTGTAC